MTRQFLQIASTSGISALPSLALSSCKVLQVTGFQYHDINRSDRFSLWGKDLHSSEKLEFDPRAPRMTGDAGTG